MARRLELTDVDARRAELLDADDPGIALDCQQTLEDARAAWAETL